MKLGVINHTIGLDVPSGNSPINSEMVEDTPISNLSPQVHHRPDYNQESSTRSHEWDKLIADKKSIVEITLDQCDKATRAEITLGPSYEDDLKAGALLTFLMKVRKVCTDTEDKDVFSGPV